MSRPADGGAAGRPGAGDDPRRPTPERPGARPPRVELRGVARRFGATTVLAEISLAIAEGELLVLLGRSGCGKSTLLRVIAGLDPPSAGELYLCGQRASHLPPDQRDLAMVFQSYALYPHLTVAENIGFPLTVKGVARAERARRVEETARLLGLEGLLDRRPGALSGGQRQRVAIGRALIKRPSLFLMDEPLSNLDAALRTRMRLELKALHARLGATMVYVTHDQTEAMTLATRVAILEQGVLQQLDTPERIYRAPANRFVASFLGSPPMNLIEGRLEGGAFVAAGGRLSWEPGAALAEGLARALDGAAGGERGGARSRAVTLGLRPEDVRLAAEPGPGRLAARVELCEPVGDRGYVHLRVDEGAGGYALAATVPGARAFELAPGTPLHVELDAARAHWFSTATGLRLGLAS